MLKELKYGSSIIRKNTNILLYFDIVTQVTLHIAYKVCGLQWYNCRPNSRAGIITK